MLKKAVARTVAEYVDVIAGLTSSTGNNLWFRGHAHADWELVPSGLRTMETFFDYYGRPVAPGTVLQSSGTTLAGPSVQSMLENFKRRTRPFISRRPENDFEWMFLAQHHGLPTRLLDWSTNALVALFFAASTAESGRDDVEEAISSFLDDGPAKGFAVFVIDPGEFNNAIADVNYPIDIAAHHESWSHYRDTSNGSPSALLPICVTAPQNSERIRAQSGAFTLHGVDVRAIESYQPLQPLITKVFMPAALSQCFRADLLRLGMTGGFIYADLDSVAEDVVAEEGRRFAWLRAEHAREAAAYWEAEEVGPQGKTKNKTRRRS